MCLFSRHVKAVEELRGFLASQRQFPYSKVRHLRLTSGVKYLGRGTRTVLWAFILRLYGSAAACTTLHPCTTGSKAYSTPYIRSLLDTTTRAKRLTHQRLVTPPTAGAAIVAATAAIVAAAAEPSPPPPSPRRRRRHPSVGSSAAEPAAGYLSAASELFATVAVATIGQAAFSSRPSRKMECCTDPPR